MNTKSFESTIRVAAALLLGLTAVTCGCAHSTEPAETAEADADAGEYAALFVHTAAGIRYENGTLTLDSVHQKTLYFADRPDRVVGWMPTGEFVEDWDVGDDSFKSNATNADVSVFDGKEFHEHVVVLTNPRPKDGDLIYDVETLMGELPKVGGPTTMFVDPGHRRRQNRRVARRTARRTSRRYARRHDDD